MPRKDKELSLRAQKKAYPQKPTSYNKLTKAIKRLEAVNKQDHIYLNYGNVVTPTNLSANVDVFHLTNTNNWNVIFGTDAADADTPKVIYCGLGMDIYINSNNEPAQIQFTCFLVSLTDLIGQNFNVGSGALGLTSGFHYSIQGGMVLLNKKCFNIHKMKRFVLGNNATALSNPSAQTQHGSDKRFYWKLSRNQTFMNPYGDWKPINAQLDPNKNLYLLVFNDNSALDLENPQIQFNIVHTVKKNI